MSRQTTHSQRGSVSPLSARWPSPPPSGPTRRFEIEYLVRRESEALCQQMKEAGIEHRALLDLDKTIDPQRVAGYVDTRNLFVNAVAFHAEKVAEAVSRDMGTEERRRIKVFLDNLRAQHPLSKKGVERLVTPPADLQDVFRRSVQTD